MKKGEVAEYLCKCGGILTERLVGDESCYACSDCGRYWVEPPCPAVVVQP